jgi:hypothetical protein
MEQEQVGGIPENGDVLSDWDEPLWVEPTRSGTMTVTLHKVPIESPSFDDLPVSEEKTE